MEINQNKLKILVVDDHPSNLNFLAKLLKNQGYQVQRAISGQLALNAALKSPPDLILLDIIMPDMDGYEVCAELKAQAQTQDIPIIFLSILDEVSEKVKGFQAGSVDYITKPFQTEEILARINNQLTIQKLQKQLKEQNFQLKQEIRDRVKAEAEKNALIASLQKSQASLAAAQRVAHVGSWEFDVLTGKFTWSEELFRICGLDPTQPEPTYAQLLKLIHPEDRAICQATVRHTIESGNRHELDLRILRTDGQARYIEGRGEVIVNEQGQAIRLFGTALDITARKNAEVEILRSKELLESVFNGAADAIFLVNPETGLIVDCNQRAVELFEAKSKDELLNMQGHTLQKEPFTPEEVSSIFAEIYISNFWSRELEYVTKQGKLFWGNLAAKLIHVAGQKMNLVRVTDITDRKALERELALREARLNAFFASAPVGLTIMDAQLRYVQINELLAEINGIPARDQIGKTLREVIPDIAPQLEPLYRQVLATGEPILNKEVRGEAPSQPGILRDWVVSYFPILGENNRPSGLGGVVVEITDRKRAEAALRDSEERFNLAVSGTNDGIWDWDIRTDQTYFSPVWMEILGYPEGELPHNSTTWTDRVHPDDLQKAISDFQDHLDGKTPIFQNTQRVKHKDGRWVWIEAKGKCLRDRSGKPERMTGTIADITQRKLSELALQESATRERAIASAIQRMRQTLDLETIFTATTQELRQVINCDRVLVYRFHPDWNGELVAESVGSGWISLVQEQANNSKLTENALQDERCTVKAFDSASSLVQDTYLQETSGGAYSRGASHLAVEDIYQAGFASCYINLLEQFQARAYITVPIFCGSKLWGLLATYQNSAPRQWKAAEINVVVQIGTQLGVALQQAELLAQTQKQSEALQQAVIVADAANRAKSEFLANMSHELRTPLNAILGFTQVMSRDDSLSAQQQENLEIINRAGSHLLELINDILEMSKIEAGRITFNENSFDLMRLLNSLEKMLRLRAEFKGLQLQFECAPDLPQYVRTDESKLRQVLMNLLGNAIKFTETGSVTLRVRGDLKISRSQDPKIPRSQDPKIPRSPLSRLLFEVEDTGPGIATEEIAMLFAAFEQTETGRKSHQGTGLGLAISRKYVQLMGGDIRISSTPGQGSLFAFDIQINFADATEIQITQSKRKVIGLAPNQPEYRILVVDDAPDSRLVLVKLLTSIGFQVREASNGQEAVISWSSWQPHLIWMDMRMPVMDGYEATKQIKAREQERWGDEGKFPITAQYSITKTVIIALTASAFLEQRKAILSAGCDDFVCKPFRQEVILEKMSQFLGVRYLYEEENRNTEKERQIIKKILTTAQWQSYFSQMPAEWVAQVHSASCLGSDDVIFKLIEQIPEENAALALALTDLATHFQFEKIMKLTMPEGE